MDVADRGADLGVAVRIDVFLEEVDQPAVALEDREDPQVRSGRRPGEERLDPCREIGLGQDSPESLEGQPESVQGSDLAIGSGLGDGEAGERSGSVRRQRSIVAEPDAGRSSVRAIEFNISRSPEKTARPGRHARD